MTKYSAISQMHHNIALWNHPYSYLLNKEQPQTVTTVNLF